MPSHVKKRAFTLPSSHVAFALLKGLFLALRFRWDHRQLIFWNQIQANTLPQLRKKSVVKH